MNRCTTIAVLAGTLLLAGANQVMAAAEPLVVGEVEKLQANAEAEQNFRTRPLDQQSPLLFQDLVRTQAGARLQALLADGTQLTLGENAWLKIDDFVYTPGGNEGRLSMSVLAGAFLFVGGQIDSSVPGGVEINTPVGTLGVRGTTVWGGRIGGGYGVLVLDGEVTVTTQGGSVTLHAGEATMVAGPEAAPQAPHQWSEEMTARAVATISFVE